jgi:hypothetical protein
MRKIIPVLPLLLSLMLSSCSEEPKKSAQKKELEAPAEPVTARTAVQNIFGSARAWAPDAQILKMVNIPLQGVKAEPGKFGAWQVTMVSPSKGRAKIFTYSVVEGGGSLHKGVFGTPDDAYTQRGQEKPFIVAALKTDSDQALEAAMKKAVDYVKKNPDKPVNFLLELKPDNPNPMWRVIWGESIGTSNFSIYVDASTGSYLKTMH